MPLGNRVGRSRYITLACILIAFSNVLFLSLTNNITSSNNLFNANEPRENYTPLLSLGENPNARPLNVTHHATLTKVEYPLALNHTSSFTLIGNWSTEHVKLEYNDVSQYKDQSVNGSFDHESDDPCPPWRFKSNRIIDVFKNESKDNAYKLTARKDKDYNLYDYGYWEETYTVNEPFTAGRLATFSLDFQFDSKVPSNNFSVYLGVINNGVEKNQTFAVESLPIQTFDTISMSYYPLDEGQLLPGEVTLRAGIVCHNVSQYSGISRPKEDQKLDLYGVEFKTWTNINEKYVLKTKDKEFNEFYPYLNYTYGKGFATIDKERTSALTKQYQFITASNVSGEISLRNITITSNASKLFNSTIGGIDGSPGSVYSLKDDKISWETEFHIDIPYGDTLYSNHWVEIEKPDDWEVTHILDGYDVNHISDGCTGTGIGSTKVTIPEGVIAAGIWTLKAESWNYAIMANSTVWNGTDYIIESRIMNGEKFKLNVELNETVDPTNTMINLTITNPNGTSFLNRSKSIVSRFIEFGDFTVGNNMSTGTYQVTVEWTNSKVDYLKRDKVGLIQFEFEVWHLSNLTAIDTYIERIAGDPCIIKVNYSDYDLNTSIAFATVTYNSTFGQSGSMVYIGSGTYFLDLDTSGLGLGDYHLSFNASKKYYQNQTSIDLIHLKILAQPLALEVPETVINGMGNEYISCQVNVTGAISGSLIYPANLSTNWENPYSVTDHNNGTYSLNFSTWDLPTEGIIRTFSISIFANKTNYGNTMRFITITIHPIQAVVSVNRSAVTVAINKIVNIEVNYSIEESGLLIPGANCSVSWLNPYDVFPNAHGFTVRLYTVNISINTYTALIKLEKPGFETVYKTITITISPVNMIVSTIGFQDSIEAFIGEKITIKINVTEPDTYNYIENATVFYEWEFGIGYFEYANDGIYELELTLPQKGNHKVELTISKEESIYATTAYSFIVTILEEAASGLGNIILVIIFSLLGIIAIFGTLVLRTYVFLPKKRKKKLELLAKTQRYKDIMSIEALLISSELSGLQIYLKSYFSPQKFHDEILSGFVQAITMLSDQIIEEEPTEVFAVKEDQIKGIDSIMDLDFRHFNFFICDYKEIRMIFILREKASERFKKQTAKFLTVLEEKFPGGFKNWDGDLQKFNKIIPLLLEEYFQLYYKESFKVNNIKDINRIIEDEELSTIETRLLNVIKSMTKDNDDFNLKDPVEVIHEKNKDLVIEALESLITKGIIISSKA
ncbi:MAG: hypothetical protein ACW97V_07425 [Promethearchaeota archaeon]